MKPTYNFMAKVNIKGYGNIKEGYVVGYTLNMVSAIQYNVHPIRTKDDDTFDSSTITLDDIYISLINNDHPLCEPMLSLDDFTDIQVGDDVDIISLDPPHDKGKVLAIYLVDNVDVYIDAAFTKYVNKENDEMVTNMFTLAQLRLSRVEEVITPDEVVSSKEDKAPTKERKRGGPSSRTNFHSI